jgi:molybdopterin converting factor subunit 1
VIKVLLFAGLAEKLGKKELVLDHLPDSVTELTAWLKREYPLIAGDLERCMIALNEEYAGPEAKLKESDVVALIPPVSGG